MPFDFTIARLNARDAKGRSDHLLNLREMVSQKEDVYPGIDRWFEKRVISGVNSKDRAAYIGYLDKKPAAAAILKLGRDSKICHLSISTDLQNHGLGDLFLCLLALEARRHAKDIHLTLPESLWQTKSQFFQSFGFAKVEIAETQYRLFDRELAARVDFKTLWSSVLGKISKLNRRFSLAGNPLSDGLLFSVKPEYGEMIMNGTKRIELRRRFSKKWKGHRAVFYATEPVCGLLGQATIQEVHEGTPKKIWGQFGDQIRCSQEFYNSYVAGSKTVFAIVLSEINPFLDPIFTAGFAPYADDNLVPPQSYLHLDDRNGWSQAVNIAVMLQCLHKRLALPSNTVPSHLYTIDKNSSSKTSPILKSIDSATQRELF